MATKSAPPVAPSNNTAKNDAKSSNLRRMPRTLAGTPAPDDATRRQTLALYESALKLMDPLLIQVILASMVLSMLAAPFILAKSDAIAMKLKNR